METIPSHVLAAKLAKISDYKTFSDCRASGFPISYKDTEKYISTLSDAFLERNRLLVIAKELYAALEEEFLNNDEIDDVGGETELLLQLSKEIFYNMSIPLDMHTRGSPDLSPILESWIAFIDRQGKKDSRRPMFMRLLWLTYGASFTCKQVKDMITFVDTLDVTKEGVRKLKEWLACLSE
jgi:hypothetical protein